MSNDLSNEVERLTAEVAHLRGEVERRQRWVEFWSDLAIERGKELNRWRSGALRQAS